MRKIVTLIPALALLLALFSPGPALAAPTTTVVFTIGSTTYTVNGEPQQMDVAPYIDSNGRTQGRFGTWPSPLVFLIAISGGIRC